MDKKHIIFRLTAFSAAAGKYNPEAPLDGNEDNFYVDDDLVDDILGRFQPDKDILISDCGCLMVVADGMGGMNAGEVASEIAIETVKDFFAPGKISPQMAESPVERRKYLEQVIKEADQRIKADSKENASHEGMGSTIILAWIVGNKMTVSWCGDSRAYRFNPQNGLELLSCDHSYVQELVNQGVIRYEETFSHPQGNIVTRSLGDPNGAAKPETRQFDVFDEDIILLCSDGLNGVLRDRKTKDYNGDYYPGDNIEDLIASHTSSMTECRDALLQAAEAADWYDNVTILLCQIMSGAGSAAKKEESAGGSDGSAGDGKRTLKHKMVLCAEIVSVCLLLGLFCYIAFVGPIDWHKDQRESLLAKLNFVRNKADKDSTVLEQDSFFLKNCDTLRTKIEDVKNWDKNWKNIVDSLDNVVDSLKKNSGNIMGGVVVVESSEDQHKDQRESLLEKLNAIYTLAKGSPDSSVIRNTCDSLRTIIRCEENWNENWKNEVSELENSLSKSLSQGNGGDKKKADQGDQYKEQRESLLEKLNTIYTLAKGRPDSSVIRNSCDSLRTIIRNEKNWNEKWNEEVNKLKKKVELTQISD